MRIEFVASDYMYQCHLYIDRMGEARVQIVAVAKQIECGNSVINQAVSKTRHSDDSPTDTQINIYSGRDNTALHTHNKQP